MLENILSAFYSTHWAILPAKYDQIESYLLARMLDGKTPDLMAFQNRGGDGKMAAPYTKHGSVAVVPIHGVIYPRGGANPESGLTTGEHITRAVNAAADDASVSTLVLDVNSPGGTVAGTMEAMSAISAARLRKPVIASVHPMAASGGYGLASQASSIAINPTARVGSIGVMTSHVDKSAMLEKLGVKVTDIKSVPLKNEAPSHLPLSEAARSYEQAQVDTQHRAFVGAIALGRGRAADHVEQHFGQGRMLMAEDAMRAGMVDRIATLEEVIATARESAAAKDRARVRMKLAGVG